MAIFFNVSFWLSTLLLIPLTWFSVVVLPPAADNLTQFRRHRRRDCNAVQILVTLLLGVLANVFAACVSAYFG